MQINDDGTADLFARFDSVTAVAIDRRVRALAKAEDISHAEAHARLVQGDNGVRIVLNIYQAGDIPDAPVYVQRAGWINSAVSTALVCSATTTRDMEAASNIVTQSYSTPEVLEAFVEGRDGECRYPTCSVSAEFCDNDHRINHADGGGTQASNLVKLCRHHHNIKTSGRIFYIQDPLTGDLVWLLADGTYLLDSATGPLSTDSKQWLQTFAQRRENRNQHARAEAQRQKVLKSGESTD